jgi:hypothetical protein
MEKLWETIKGLVIVGIVLVGVPSVLVTILMEAR